MVRNERATASGHLAVVDIALAPITLTFGRRPAPDRSLLGQRLPCPLDFRGGRRARRNRCRSALAYDPTKGHKINIVSCRPASGPHA